MFKVYCLKFNDVSDLIINTLTKLIVTPYFLASSDKCVGEESVRIAPLCDFVSATALQCYSSLLLLSKPL